MAGGAHHHYPDVLPARERSPELPGPSARFSSSAAVAAAIPAGHDEHPYVTPAEAEYWEEAAPEAGVSMHSLTPDGRLRSSYGHEARSPRAVGGAGSITLPSSSSFVFVGPPAPQSPMSPGERAGSQPALATVAERGSGLESPRAEGRPASGEVVDPEAAGGAQRDWEGELEVLEARRAAAEDAAVQAQVGQMKAEQELQRVQADAERAELECGELREQVGGGAANAGERAAG